VEYFKRNPDFQVAVFDNRGVGYSSTPQGPYTMSMMADDTLAVADALGWATFHLVGVSMGGMISQHVALKAPQRLQSLTLITTRMETGFLLSLPPVSVFSSPPVSSRSF
jgi:pimeloyl-ACP methyl ester carboxylesterase